LKPEAVIFDLDDTLYSERSYAFSGFDAVANAFAGRLGSAGEMAALMRQLFDSAHRSRVFNEVLRQRGLGDDPAMVAAMVTAFRTHAPNIQLYADADAALTFWRAHGKTGIISDGLVIMQRAKILALSLSARVDEIILTDELGADFAKPSPKAFETLAARWGVDHGRCVYVADNPAKDFIAPNALGWRSVRVVRADGVYRDHPIAPGGAPHDTIASLAKLPDLLH